MKVVSPDAAPAPSHRLMPLIGLGLFWVTIAIYAPVRQYEFLRYDDGVYVTKEPMVQAGLTWAGLRWAFTHFHAAFWHPLTSISLMIDRQLWGSWAGGYHLTNVALHGLNTVLLFVALYLLTGARWRSAIVAGLFAWHPLHVESVAWVAQRKDVLSTCFMFCTLIAYVRYVRARSWRNYALVMVVFTLGLMAKPMLVTLPFVLLLLDAWPLGRFSLDTTWRGLPVRVVVEKLPLLALAAAASVAKIVGHHNETVVAYPLSLRIENALVSYVAYLGKTVWPERLTFYEYPPAIPTWEAGAAAIALAIVTVGALALWRRAPYVTIGWLWFAGMLVPVSGIVQIASHSMADRYTYVSLIGVFVAGVWGVEALTRPWRERRAPLVFASVVLLLMVLAGTAQQLRHWRSQLTLFEHAVDADPTNPVSLNNLAWIRAANPRPEMRDGKEAVRLAERAVVLMPGAPALLDTLGAALAEAGRYDEASAVAHRALDAATATHDVELVTTVRQRLQRYERHESIRDATAE